MRQCHKMFQALIVGLVLALSALLPMAVEAQQPWVWRTLGGDPRHAYGIWSWDQYYRVVESSGGQNDMRRVKMPANVTDALIRGARQLRLNGQRGGSLVIDGIQLRFSDAVVSRGTNYQFITYGAGGYRAENVVTGFDNGAVYRATAQLPDGTLWTYDTFKVCGNGARAISILTVRPPAPPPEYVPLPPVPAPQPVAFVPGTTAPLAVERATQHSSQVQGIFPHLANIAARWLGRPVQNIAVQGSSAAGGAGGMASATTAPINVSQNQQQQSANTNQNQVITPINIVTGDNSAGTATGAGAQDAGTILQQDQD